MNASTSRLPTRRESKCQQLQDDVPASLSDLRHEEHSNLRCKIIRTGKTLQFHVLKPSKNTLPRQTLTSNNSRLLTDKFEKIDCIRIFSRFFDSSKCKAVANTSNLPLPDQSKLLHHPVIPSRDLYQLLDYSQHITRSHL